MSEVISSQEEFLDKFEQDIFECKGITSSIMVCRMVEPVSETYDKFSFDFELNDLGSFTYIEIKASFDVRYQIMIYNQSKRFNVFRFSNRNKSFTNLPNGVGSCSTWDVMVILVEDRWSWFIDMLYRLEDKFSINIMDKIDI